MSNSDYRFEVAISFAGEKKRDLVRKVAELLREKLGEGKVFFDEWFEAELAGPDAHVLLQKYYRKMTRLVVTCVCNRYGEKPWTQEEWRAIQAFERDLRDAGKGNVKRMRFLPLRFGDGEIDGLFENAIVPDVRDRTPDDIAELILKRLGLAKDEKEQQSAQPVPAIPAAKQSLTPEEILVLEEKVKQIRVDREQEKNLFRDMVTKKSPVRALLIEAESGMGKSCLIEHFVHLDAPFRHALIDFKNASFTFGEVLMSVCRQIGVERFPDFDAVCRDLLLRSNAPQLRNLLASQIDEVLHQAPSDDHRNHRRRQILDALSTDLISITKILGMPVVVIIDTFERANDSLKNWISQDVVPRISAAEDIIWVIAGQKTPTLALNDTSWLVEQRLQPLSLQHCREYLKTIRLEWEEVLIKYITEISEGKPKELQHYAILAVTRV